MRVPEQSSEGTASHAHRHVESAVPEKHVGLSMPDQLPVLSASNAVVTKISRPKIEWAKLANTCKQDSHRGIRRSSFLFMVTWRG
jgi:hypothetical protein